MTDILSTSPYAYLDGLPPAERQAAIRLRQHQRREEWCDDARRARDYQARIAKLEAALEPFNCEPDKYQANWRQHEDWREDLNFVNARAALRK